ncbi:TetR/AcrR family transcriptional regulator [Microbacterium fluvii]|uniref:TetR/AcrR family transcriptional regulator n=1 Tax=Microbacterium fluvii TaxID=415215 RepID=A0ABW2HI16_9MICO|nr:TetR/AcrR family transcriptional regulator [Microbacterium fluvii]MCU4673111.1 TetR/AcrR family transcriptional regulator [Microbacterium fluvii]
MSTPARPLRRDAQRNRAEVLAAAERVFARAGLAASIEEIAAEAGVGVGTVYRRIGSKGELIEALFTERMSEVTGMIERCAAAPTGREALESVLRTFVDIQTRSRAVQELMFADIEAEAARLRREVEPQLTAIVARAQAEGAVRSDFAATDIPVLTHAISTVAAMPDGGRALAERHLELLIKGLAATPDTASVPPPLPDDRFADWLRSLAR